MDSQRYNDDDQNQLPTLTYPLWMYARISLEDRTPNTARQSMAWYKTRAKQIRMTAKYDQHSSLQNAFDVFGMRVP